MGVSSDFNKLEVLSFEVIGAAIEVHKQLGPGLLESTYEKCLAYELSLKGIRFQFQTGIPLAYKDIIFDVGYRLDFIIEDSIILELKAVDSLLRIHHAQILTYMRLQNISLGLLINFNSAPLKNGIKRFKL